jgi:hypothetical protein
VRNFEWEFSSRLSNVRQDSRACAVYVYTELTFHHLTSSEPRLIDGVRQHAAFWNGVLGGLQTAVFVTLGRLFDDDQQTYNLENALRYAEQHPGIFSRDALAARKRAAGVGPDEAALYVKDAFVLERGGLAALRAEFNAKYRLYVERVRPIRNQVFAHSGKLTPEDRDGLFTRVFVRDLEGLTVFALQVCEALTQLYDNGLEPTLRQCPSLITEVIQAVPDPQTITWEHLHAARETLTFLEAFRELQLHDR